MITKREIEDESGLYINLTTFLGHLINLVHDGGLAYVSVKGNVGHDGKIITAKAWLLIGIIFIHQKML